MPTFTVHAPQPGRTNDVSRAVEQFVFVRDGFYFWTFVLAPLWLLVHRLWLALLVYVVGYGALSFAFAFARAPSTTQFTVTLPPNTLKSLAAIGRIGPATVTACDATTLPSTE